MMNWWDVTAAAAAAAAVAHPAAHPRSCHAGSTVPDRPDMLALCVLCRA